MSWTPAPDLPVPEPVPDAESAYVTRHDSRETKRLLKLRLDSEIAKLADRRPEK